MSLKALLFPLLIRPSTASETKPLAPEVDKLIHSLEVSASTPSQADVFEIKSFASVAQDPALDSLNQEVKAAFYSLKSRLTEKEQALLYSLVKSEAFQGLDAKSRAPRDLTKVQRQLQILYLLGGQNPISTNVRDYLFRNNITHPRDMIAGLQTKSFLGQSEFVGDLFKYAFSNAEPSPSSLDFIGSGKTNDGLDAQVYQLSILGKKITLKHVNDAPLSPEHVKKAISHLPATCIFLLEEVEIHGESQTVMATASVTSSGKKLMSIYSHHYNEDTDAMCETLAHEAGHLLMYQGTDEDFKVRQAQMAFSSLRDVLFHSSYAEKNPREAWAEFFLLHQVFEKKGFLDELRYIFPDRYLVLNEAITAFLNTHGPFPEGR